MTREKRLIMDKVNTSSENIAEALKLLEEAAEQKKDELKSVMSDKYTHLRGMILETEKGFTRVLGDAKKHAVEAVVHAKDVSVEKSRAVAQEVDKSVHTNPWAYIGGTAVVGLVLGFVLARSRK
jgi:ElaB/YqjD/DUF883 family membrane-anchored ribosome-binding protein